MKTTIGGRELILIPSPKDAAFTGKLLENVSVKDPLVARLAPTAGARELPLEFAEDANLPEGGYRLEISPDGVEVTAGDDEGRRNALSTVAEMVRQTGGVAVARIEDAPGFPVRAVIEGYCGKPWPQEGRLRMFEFMALRKFNLFLSSTRAPKTSFNWRDPFDEADLAEMAEAFEAAEALGIHYVFSIRPADITVSNDEDRKALLTKIKAVFDLGVRRFMLLEDDVSRPLPEADAAAYGDYGSAHTALAGEVHNYLTGLDGNSRLIFCPTPYTTMSSRGPGMRDYLAKMKQSLPRDVEVIWTGPYCCSSRITAANARYYGSLIGRKPFLWDNYPVVDGRPGVLFLGPIRRRAADLSQAVSGYGTNLMDYPVLNFVPVSTIAEYLWNPETYSGEAAIEEAMKIELGEKALPAAARIVEIFSTPGNLPTREEGPAGATEVYLEKKGDPEAAAQLERISAELEGLVDKLARLTDNAEFVQAVRAAVSNLVVLAGPVRLDVEIERLRAAGDEEGVEKLQQQRQAMYEKLKSDLKHENLAAVSYLNGNWRYYRELTGDTSTTI
ncbi:MAG: beta-N-acetylglucosaminidase domain-containing protein [Planctomycetes bacterium]|nr:beta-N-acetylglucosaminidase domain-containing protein [Planctomycetota bacterium]